MGSLGKLISGTRDRKRNQKSYSTLEEAKIAIADFTLERAENDRLARIDEKNKRFGFYDLTDVGPFGRTISPIRD